MHLEISRNYVLLCVIFFKSKSCNNMQKNTEKDILTAFGVHSTKTLVKIYNTYKYDHLFILNLICD